MKKLLFLLIPGLLVVNLVFSQKTYNDLNAEKRSVGSFHGIEVGTGIELMLSEGSLEEVAVSASTNEYRDRIITRVDKGILKIHYDNQLKSVNRKGDDKKLRAYVSYKMLDLLNASTGAEVKIHGVLKSAILNMEVNTGAHVDGEMNTGTLKVKQNTGSKMTLTGKTEKLDVEGDTGSKFIGDALSTISCTVMVSTGAQVRVQAEKELQAKANTGGNIKYKGNATILDIKTNTGGTVSKI